MSNSAPRARRGDSRRRVAILGGILAGFIILVLLLLGFCNNGPDPDPPVDTPVASRSTIPPGTPSTTQPTAGPSETAVDPGTPATRPPATRPATRPPATRTATATHTVPPKGGPDTGGGSTAPSGVVLFAVGLVILLGAVGATVQAFRPRRSRR